MLPYPTSDKLEAQSVGFKPFLSFLSVLHQVSLPVVTLKPKHLVPSNTVVIQSKRTMSLVLCGATVVSYRVYTVPCSLV